MASCVTGGDGETDSGHEIVGEAEDAVLGPGSTSTDVLAEPLDQGSPGGSIPGTFQVDATGAATYTIPIQVPPGFDGVQPKLALVYNSRAGNGIAGMGFSLAGLPVITRCARTVAQDGVRGGVNGDANDRFCLDGQRLVAISGTYGENDTVYHTEIETWSRIVSKGNCNTGICHFEVIAKDGTRVEIGNVPGSRTILPNGLYRTWGVTKVTSPRGNYMTVSYVQKHPQWPERELYPAEILYTFRKDNQATRRRFVTFFYTERPDVETSYVHGGRWKSDLRLLSIMTGARDWGSEEFTNWRPATFYSFEYTVSPRTHRSLLTSVKRCGNHFGECLQPTTFTWPEAETETFVPVFPAGAVYQDNLRSTPGAFIKTGDFNGDGRADFIRQEHSGNDNDDINTFSVFQSKGTGYYDVKYPLIQHHAYQHDLRYDDGANIVTGDFDGDGRMDFLRQPRWVGTGPFRVHYSRTPVVPNTEVGATEARFEMVEPLGDIQSAMTEWGARIIPGDFNGDGRTDFIRQEQGTWAADYESTFRVYFSTDVNGEFTMVEPPGLEYQRDLRGHMAQIIPGDFNGDGKTDFIRHELIKWNPLKPQDIPVGAFSVYFSKGDGTFEVVYPVGSEYQDALVFSDGALMFPGDFNGDGKTDFLRQEHGGWATDAEGTVHVYLSRGNGYFDVVYPQEDAIQHRLRYSRAFVHLLDFNGDGRMDILSQEHGDWGADVVETANLYISLGNGHFRWRPLPGYAFDDLLRFDPGCQLFVSDVDGDGNEDLVRQERGYWDDNDIGTFAVYFANGPKGTDLLKSVRDGFGGTTEIDYGPLTDPLVHAIDPDNDFAQPKSRPMRSPMYVVKKVVQRDRGEGPNVDTFEHTYFYKDGRFDQTGRGFLGFAEVVDTDVGTGSVTTTKYHQAFPFTGKPEMRETVFADDTQDPNDNPRVRTTLDYAGDEEDDEEELREPYSGVFEVVQTAEETYHMEGSTSYTTRTEYQYSDYGNLGLVRHKGLVGYDGDDYDTCTTFYNDPATWRLGYPTNITDARACLLVNGECWCPAEGPDFLAGEHRDYFTDGGRMLLGGSSRWNSTNQAWEITYYEYDPIGRLTRSWDPVGVVEQITYDPDDAAFVMRSDVCGFWGTPCLSRYTAYDPRFGEQVMEVDENGVLRTRVLDGLGRLSRTREKNPDGQLVDVTKHIQGTDSDDRPYRETRRRTGWEADAPWTSEIEYLDGFGRTTQRAVTKAGSSSDPVILKDMDFDPKSGLLVSESQPYFSTAGSWEKAFTTRTYDSQGRLVKITEPAGPDPAGAEVTMTYAIVDPSDTTLFADRDCPTCVSRVTFTEPGNRVWHRFLDAAGRTVMQVDADGRVTSFAYDRLGRKIAATDSAGATTTFAYDSLGRVVSTTSPDRGTFQSVYSGNGLLQQTTDARGVVIKFEYDALGRLTQKVTEGVERVVYEYDQDGHSRGKGRLTTASVYPWSSVPPLNPSSRFKISYSFQGRPARVVGFIDGHDFDVKTVFDPLGRAREITHHDGTVVTRSYDVFGRLTSAELKTMERPDAPSETVGADFPSHNASGQPLALDFLNGVKTSYTYDTVGQLTQLKTTKGTRILQKHEYTWDPARRLTDMTDTHAVTTNGVDQNIMTELGFTYTSAGMLLSATRGTSTLTYGYDAIGNLTNKEGVTQVYEGHRLTETRDGSTTLAFYEHDAAGNRTLKKTATHETEYVHDSENRLTEVRSRAVLPGGTLGPAQTLSKFLYGPFGDRVRKIDQNGVKTLYFGPDVEVTIFPGATPTKLVTRYLSGPSGRLGSHTGNYLTMSQAASAFGPLTELDLPPPRSPRELLAVGASLISLWWRTPGAGWQLALGLAFLALLAAAARPAAVRRALRAAAAFHDRVWASRFDTRFVRRHRHQALVVPLVLASFLAGCFPTRVPVGDDEDTTSVQEALTAGANGAGYPVAGIQYYHHDHIGSSSVVTDAAGVETARVQYKPFGEIDDAASPGVDAFRAKFTGKEWEKDIGLYHFGARYYDPQTGRFLTADSFLHGGPEHLTASLDPYAYAVGNPVIFTDPSGHAASGGGALLIAAIVIGVILGAYMGGAATNGTYDISRWDAKDWRTWVGVTVGGVAGGVAGGVGAVGGIGAAMASGFILTASTEGLKFLSDDGNTWEKFLIEVGIGTGASAFGGGVGGRIGKSAARSSAKGVARSNTKGVAKSSSSSKRAGEEIGTRTADAILLGREIGNEYGLFDASSNGGAVHGSPARSGNAPPPPLRGTTPALQDGQADGAFQQPQEVRVGAAHVERFGASLVRGNMGHAPLIEPVIPIEHHTCPSLAELAAAMR